MIGVIEKAFTATEVVCNFRFIGWSDAISNLLEKIVDFDLIRVVSCTCEVFRGWETVTLVELSVGT